jgi:hypothetical protein
VREQNDFSSDRIVINIQDAHAHLGAQESIATLLDNLVKRYDLKLVSLEGAGDYVDTSLISSFPDEQVRRKTGQALLRRGQISAGEFYSMVSEKPMILFGAENKKLYEANLEAFRELADKRVTVDAQLKRLHEAILKLEKTVYAENLRNFLIEKRRFRNSSGGFSKYWETCRSTAAIAGMSFESYSNLRKLNDALGLETGIDFNKASEERRLLIEELTQLLAKERLKEFVRLAVDYKKDKTPDVRFYRSLIGYARDLSLSLREYPNLTRYLGYLERYEQVDFLGLMSELEKFEKELIERLINTPESGRLHRLSECARLLTALLDVRMENADYEKYMRLDNYGSTRKMKKN